MLRLTVFNVGQASSILLDFGKGRLGVIDCGIGISGGNPLSAEIARRFDRDSSCYLSFVLFTHLDWDHISGFEDLLSPVIKKRIRRLYCNGLEFRLIWEIVGTFVRRHKKARFDQNKTVARNMRSLGHIHKLLASPPHKDFHGELVSPESSDPTAYPVQIKLADLGGDFMIKLFAPSQSLRNRTASWLRRILGDGSTPASLLESIGKSHPDWNAASAVLSIEYKGVRMLFGGDANHLTWSDIFSRDGYQSVESDIIVAWHHGARLGSYGGEDYDEKVWSYILRGDRAKLPCALVSHGCGQYGHPHDKTVRSISKYGARVICTQLREGLVKDANERREAISAANLDIHPGIADEWDIYRTDSNSCSGTIAAEFGNDGKFSIVCDGPRQLGDAPTSSCCLFDIYNPTDDSSS